MSLLERFPILVWAGAALLGWVAGEIIVKDAAVVRYLGAEFVESIHLWSAVAGAVLVVAAGWLLRRAKRPVESEV
jgi:LPXTG-motif cell wall-anchored protein